MKTFQEFIEEKYHTDIAEAFNAGLRKVIRNKAADTPFGRKGVAVNMRLNMSRALTSQLPIHRAEVERKNANWYKDIANQDEPNIEKIDFLNSARGDIRDDTIATKLQKDSLKAIGKSWNATQRLK